MDNSYASLSPYRWTERDIASFYDDERTARLRKRSVAACAFAILIATLVQPWLYFAWLFSGVALAAVLDYYLKQPLRSRDQYEALLQKWNNLWEASAPDARMQTTAKLADGEHVIYARQSQRHAERVVNNLAVNSFVEAGELVVTDRRVLFLGDKNTLAVNTRDVLRYTPSYDGRQITFEYAQRPAGESFTVEVPFFALCMNRRGNFSQFSVERPGPLPLLDPGIILPETRI